LLLYAIDRVKTQAIFNRDPYESRREALPGSRLLKVLVFYQMLKDLSFAKTTYVIDFVDCFARSQETGAP
jgi:hypothetical protein